MKAASPEPSPAWTIQLDEFLHQLQYRTLLLALAGAFLLIVVLLSTTGAPAKSGQVAFMALGLVVWLAGAYGLRWWKYLAAALWLAAGCLAAVLAAVTWLKFDLALCLLLLPVGLATLAISRAAGLALALVCTLLLALAPPALLPGAPTLRLVAGLGLWSVFGLLCLALNPLLTTMGWAWRGYESSRELLEQARAYQVQLQQMLEDLSAANTQLIRLNKQAHALQVIAETERSAKERFVANVSHELRTPLNMITGFAEMITQSPQLYGRAIPPALLADLTVVLRNSQHLSSLIDDVLDLSKVQAGQMALSKTHVSLDEIIAAAVVAVRPLYESKGLYLETEVDPSLPDIFCDQTRIREVVLNLLSNAGRFTEQGGIRLRAWQEGDFVQVSVSDTGPGIAPEDQVRIFEPFQQLDGTVRWRYRGTGLGLSISRSFVELHDGKMWVESRPGHGATFTFQLPVESLPPLAAGASAHLIDGWDFLQHTRPMVASTAPVRPRLVVAESGKSLQHLLVRYQDRAEVAAFSELEAALLDLAKAPAQALLVNAGAVPAVLERLVDPGALPYGVPAIVCALPGPEQLLAGLGVVDYLVKPVDRACLLAAIERLGPQVQTLLVVDDEPDALHLYGRMLAEGGERTYRVLRAADGTQALEIMRQQPVDALLLDLVMPELDGHQLLKIKNADPLLSTLPTILLTAQDLLETPPTCAALAATCRGGLSTVQLLEAIDALLGVLALNGSPAGPASGAEPPG